MSFKKNFYWGAATASYQIEGAYNEDGKSLNIWDTFCQIPGRIDNFDNGNVACDHYHRYKEDVKLMKEIGLKAYRFSLSWSRILPNGTGEVNQKGIDFYNNLIDELLAAGIEPFVTLYHWDLPLALDKLGGWRNPLMVQWFENYAKVVAEHFSDRVKHFMTINEPQVVINLGYYVGSHAPGLKLTLSDVFDAQFILLKAHGAAVKALRTYGKQDTRVKTPAIGPKTGGQHNTYQSHTAPGQFLMVKLLLHPRSQQHQHDGCYVIQDCPQAVGRIPIALHQKQPATT
jgi:beta-glucosidase